MTDCLRCAATIVDVHGMYTVCVDDRHESVGRDRTAAGFESRVSKLNGKPYCSEGCLIPMCIIPFLKSGGYADEQLVTRQIKHTLML